MADASGVDASATVAPRVERVRHRLEARLLEVRTVERLTPAMARVTFRGDSLEDFHSAAPDDHVKLLFAPDGGIPVLPNFEPGAPRYPAGVTAPIARDYTPRRFDPVARELVVDFAIHGDGPASTWAASAAPGAIVGQAGPRGSLLVSTGFDWYLLAGDEAGLPAIARRLEELPPGARATVFVEVDDGDAELDLVTAGDLELCWLHRDGRPAGTTDLLERAIRAWEPAAGAGFAWVGAEATAARALRSHLRGERGLAKEWTRITGYWRRGVAEHHEPPDPD